MGKKKEKVIDLKPEKISEEELKQLQNVVSAINKLQFDIGVMEVQKHSALHALFQGNEKLNEMQWFCMSASQTKKLWKSGFSPKSLQKAFK